MPLIDNPTRTLALPSLLAIDENNDDGVRKVFLCNVALSCFILADMSVSRRHLFMSDSQFLSCGEMFGIFRQTYSSCEMILIYKWLTALPLKGSTGEAVGFVIAFVLYYYIVLLLCYYLYYNFFYTC